jgi:hypothetical protein
LAATEPEPCRPADWAFAASGDWAQAVASVRCLRAHWWQEQPQELAAVYCLPDQAKERRKLTVIANLRPIVPPLSRPKRKAAAAQR